MACAELFCRRVQNDDLLRPTRRPWGRGALHDLRSLHLSPAVMGILLSALVITRGFMRINAVYSEHDELVLISFVLIRVNPRESAAELMP